MEINELRKQGAIAAQIMAAVAYKVQEMRNVAPATNAYWQARQAHWALVARTFLGVENGD